MQTLQPQASCPKRTRENLHNVPACGLASTVHTTVQNYWNHLTSATAMFDFLSSAPRLSRSRPLCFSLRAIGASRSIIIDYTTRRPPAQQLAAIFRTLRRLSHHLSRSAGLPKTRSTSHLRDCQFNSENVHARDYSSFNFQSIKSNTDSNYWLGNRAQFVRLAAAIFLNARLNNIRTDRNTKQFLWIKTTFDKSNS